jgi:hypothetical protein
MDFVTGQNLNTVTRLSSKLILYRALPILSETLNTLLVLTVSCSIICAKLSSCNMKVLSCIHIHIVTLILLCELIFKNYQPPKKYLSYFYGNLLKKVINKGSFSNGRRCQKEKAFYIPFDKLMLCIEEHYVLIFINVIVLIGLIY